MAKPTNRQHIRDWFALGCGLFGSWELLLAAHWVIRALDIMTGLYRLPALELRFLARWSTLSAMLFLPYGF